MLAFIILAERPVWLQLVGGVVIMVGVRVAVTHPHRAVAQGAVAAWDLGREAEHVKDLVTGSALAFTERGSYELRGAPGSWRISKVERQIW